MDRIAIHCNSGVEWQARRADQFLAGMKALGIPVRLTHSRQRVSDIAILFGTTFWRAVELTGRFLLVDRASWGDPDFVSLVWDGHGRRGNHCIPQPVDGRRWQRIGIPIHPWCRGGARVILCGQTETYSPHYSRLEDWYANVTASHFRPHPAGGNPTGLPLARDWADAGRVVTLNSSIGVESVLSGIPTVTMDEAAMAWEVSAHDPEETATPDRRRWLEWLSWTQWTWHEIEAGEPIRHLFERL